MNFTDSNLFQLFSSLSPYEVKELDKAVRSPFFNYRDEEIRLYDYLLKTKKRNTAAITADEAIKYVYPKQKADLAKLRHVMTYLTRIIHRYLAIAEMESTGEQKKLLQARTLRKRNLSKQFLADYNVAEQYFENEAPLSPELYYYRFQLHTEYYIHSITNRRAQNHDLQQLSADLDSFYIIQKLKHACNLLSYKNVFKLEHSENMMEETMALIEKKKMLGNPLVNLLYHNYLCLSEPDNETYFVQLKDLLLNHSQRIDTKELRDIFTLAINYCIKRLNTGGQKYYQEVFEIYVAGLQRAVFEDRGQLSPFTYKNISAIAIGLKKYKWVAEFLEEYKSKLDPEIREGFYAYCMARYCFATGNYSRVMDLLQEVEIKEQFTDLDARVLLIKTYYELDEFGLLDYSNNNLKQQLKRKKLQTYHETVYGNFAKYITRLMKLRPYDKKAKAALKEKISGTGAVAEKEWLLGKI
ncbi:MAG TPA: hypothetical protein VK154_20775 [Chitinophagales bacterium]|nr:hypothetical protein [Chitinophagales bacterium]